MSKSKPFCLMPWVHFHVGQNGMVKACCVANIPFGNINNGTFEDIWQGESIKALREKFAKGDGDKRCAQCMHLEASGGRSIRMETLDKYPKFEINEPPALPTYFDIRFSNVCNLRCRTCWHGASSKWFNEAKLLGRTAGEKAIIENIKDFDRFIQEMGDTLLNAQEIYFAGGEPLVTEAHFLLLNWLIKNKATKMLLRYNTNFTVLDFKGYNILKLWSFFERVEILASIDGVGALGEYIRKDLSWQKILDNCQLLRDYKHIKFKISPTVSVYNVHHIPKLYKTCIDLELIEKEDFYINILERPCHFNIQILSPEAKAEITLLYEKFFEALVLLGLSLEDVKKFEEIINYMNGGDKHQFWPKFVQETSRLDGMRHEKWSSFSH